jgi:hypothetical protein
MVCMNVDRFSITMEPELGAAAREAATREGLSVSAWMAAAAADRVRNALLGVALDQWQSEDGVFTDAELAAARQTMARAAQADGDQPRPSAVA